MSQGASPCHMEGEEFFEEEREVTFVVERDEVDALVASVAELERNADPVVFGKLLQIVHSYQELPQLLDPHLEGWITPLAGVLRAEAHKGEDADMVLVQRTAKVLNALATVRGAKTVVKFFPHEARDLEPVVALLVRSHDAQLCVTTLEEKDELGTAWETRAVLILWLSILVLIPFDLVTVDSLAEDLDDAEAPPVVTRILRLCQDRYLSDPGIVRDRAATLLARLLTRPDMPRALASFLDWATEALAKAVPAPEDEPKPRRDGRSMSSSERAKAFAAAEQKATFLIPGVARALAAIFKLGTRGALLGVAERAWGDARNLAESPAAKGSALVRQLACKLAQRIGLLFLKPRVVAWRYERGARSLVDNLKKNGGDVSGSVATVPEAPTSSESAARAVSAGEASDDDDDVPDGVEEVIESLLIALQDKDTVVRWSAAKGLGRITARLPAEFGDEVVGSILECFAPAENENTRHGACLALAELARRGLLLPERLPDAVPHVAEALTYDVRRGPHSVGAHVRDAAAYVCWAFARAYAPEALAPHAPALGPELLVAACFDREVNCRRAAAAAFQEAVGRLGAFPHGMDVVSAADYFALGARTNAFTRVADFVCALDEYRPALLEHLLRVKLAHWERPTRELAARALGVVGQRDRDWTRDTALPVLLDRALSPAMETRHGAVVGAAEALLALKPRDSEPETERKDAGSFGTVRKRPAGVVDGALAERVVTLVRDVEKARLYRGKGGEAMRAATCRFVECLAMTGQPLDRGPGPAAGPKSLRSSLLASMEESLRHPSADVRDAATRALGEFAEAYMCGSSPEKGAERLVATLAATAEEDPNPAARRGAAAALGAMPAALLLATVKSRKTNGNGAHEPVANGETGSEREPASEQKPVVVPAWRVAMDALATASQFEEDLEARDAETRVCAVKGAAGVARTLCAAVTRARRVGGEAAAASAAATVAHETLRVCLRCIQEDYCVDNRGDVGSWVREAAMDAIPDLVVAARAAAADDAETGGAETSETLSPERAREIVCALLKQAAEKIDRVRAAAGAALASTLRGDEARALAPLRGVPAGEALLAAIPKSTSAAAWAAPSSAFPALAKLIAADDDLCGLATYRRSLLEGFVVSAGGVGDSLGKAAGGALVTVLRDDPELQRDVFKTLVAILNDRAGVDRVTTPLLRVLDVCFSVGCLGAVAPAPPAPPAPLAAALAAKLRAELKGSRDVAKLCLGVQALCHLAGLGKADAGPVSDEATCASTNATLGLLALLVNRYPRVRRVAAEQLYVTLLGCEGEDAGTEKAIELLSATRWDADLAVVKPARNALYPMLGLETPKQALVAAKSKTATCEARDENDSYAALVGSAGY